MAKGQVNPFGENLLDEAAAEAEELGTETTETTEAAPVEQPKQEAAPEPVAEPAVERGPIPYQRFQEVNEKARKAEAEASELREKWARLEERQKVIREANQAAEQVAAQQRQAAERPDPAVDPVGAELYDLKQRDAAREQALVALQQQLQNFGQNVQQTQEGAQFSNWVQATAQQYSLQDPEYQSKAKFAADKRMEFWAGLGAPADVARKMVEAESVLIARVAQQYGGSFAPLVASLATQWGYQSPNGQQPQQNGVAAARLQQVAAGQKVQGISRIPAAGPAQPSIVRNLTHAELGNMPENEWMRIKSNPQLLRELAVSMAAADGVDPEDMMSVLKSA